MSRKLFSVILLLAGAVFLSACGSGGSSASPPQEPTVSPSQEPTVTLTPESIKTFAFSWDAVDGATEYRLLENPDGSSGFTEVASADGDETALDLEVFLPGRINASYILQSCNDGGCTDSETLLVSGTLAQTAGYFKASNTDTSDRFGTSVALSADGSTLAVGARGEDSAATGIDGDQSDNSAVGAGAVYVFVRDAGVWSQQAYVKASNTDTDDWFGWSLALSTDGSTLAVGTWSEYSAATGINGDQSDNSAFDAGAVYVFVRDAGVWSQQAYVKASNTDSGDEFGGSIALSADGDTLAVGAWIEDSATAGIDGDQSDNSAPWAGAVYVFVRDAGVWSQQAYVKASNTEAGDWFGRSLDLSADGRTLAVGAWKEASAAADIDGDQNDNSADDAGAVYVFVREANVWSQQAYVKASNTDAGDEFGFSAALSADGSTLAVGAWGEASATTGIDGDQSDNSAENAGAAYVFARNAGMWSQQAYVKASNTDAGNLFGWNVALSGDGSTLAVSAYGEASAATGINGDQSGNSAEDAGAVYVFVRDANAWSQQAYVKASNTDAGNLFGWSVALSTDGSTLAVGANKEDSAATGIDGDQSDNSGAGSGAVYLY